MPLSSPQRVQIPTAFQGFLVEDQVLADIERQLPLASVDIEIDAAEVSFGSLIGVAEAAARLGVHENTIRNWTDRGILKAIRLPGGHRRLPLREVDRLRSQVLSGSVEAPEDEGRSGGRLRRLQQGQPDEGW